MIKTLNKPSDELVDFAKRKMEYRIKNSKVYAHLKEELLFFENLVKIWLNEYTRIKETVTERSFKKRLIRATRYLILKKIRTEQSMLL